MGVRYAVPVGERGFVGGGKVGEFGVRSVGCRWGISRDGVWDGIGICGWKWAGWTRGCHTVEAGPCGRWRTAPWRLLWHLALALTWWSSHCGWGQTRWRCLRIPAWRWSSSPAWRRTHALHMRRRAHRRCRRCRLVTPSLSSLRRWWSHTPHTRHTRCWFPLATIGFHLSDFSFSISYNKVCNAAD